MKKFILAIVALFCMTVSASAMSYEQARQQALFLTDKMAYELNLTDDQYEAAYEINLDYLMGVNTYDDLYGAYWRQRNLDLSYILLDWQYRSFLNASYFYRPLYWDGGYWHFAIYARYPHRDYFFFGRPNFYVSYRGGHSWRMNGGRSWYNGRSFGGPRPGGEPRMGMRDGFNRGDFGRGTSFGSMTRNNQPQSNRSFGNRQSSTRTTVTRDNNTTKSFGNQNNSGSFGSNRNNGSVGINRSNRTFGNGNSNTTTRPSGTFGGSRNNSFGGNRGGSFGSGSTTTSPAKSFTPRSTPSNVGGSFGGGNRGGGSFGGGSHSTGGSHSSGSGSFGGRR